MKGSSATSARATARARPTGRSSGRRPPTLTSADGFALSGPSEQLDPTTYAYRTDLADVALANRVIASHYAEPLQQVIVADAELRELPSDGSECIREIKAGELFAMLDNSVGWAWGYAGTERRVGYVRSEAVGAG